MSPVNNDPSNDASDGRTRPLTRREIRARERFLETQNQEVLPPPVPVHFEPVAVPKPQPAYVPHYAAAPETPSHAPELHNDGIRGEAGPSGDFPPQSDVVQPEENVQQHEASPEDALLHDAVHQDAVLPDIAHQDTAHLDTVHPDTAHPDAALPHDAGNHDAVPIYDAAYGDEFHEVHAHDEGYEHHDPHFDYEVHDEHDAHELIPAAAAVAKVPSKKVRRRRRVLALLLTLTVFVAAVAVGAQFLKPLLGMDKVSDYPGPGTGSVTVTVAPGSGPKLVATNLQNQHVIANADTFLAAFTAAGGELSPGDFTFRTEMKNSDAVNVLLNKDASKVMYFALSAGLRIGESLDAIAKGSGIPVSELKALSDSPAQFGVPAPAKNLEGFLAPGEYRFPLGTPAKDILQKLVTGTTDELKAQGVTDPTKQYQAVTVASIVQAEGGQADYGNVAGAIYNRLKPGNTETNGLIQSDATVTYGLGTKTFHLTDAQKADKSNPYNTYANVGLPVGPIGSPGKTAIDAAAKPTANNYLYWVTINLDTKETKFSSTLAEHSKYVEQYNAWCAANAGRCV
ncbi:endolytic transglycosylase MltG [Arthrobacter sp. MMS18-M83]|uniref:endolytic transglycosylase MltG n=1 Tax=Arthrobacter sp. MMS18-M83 TaxID=2996261 RepID=UPI00227B512C|nr:endolytic transglycosylase MltG [Arthrobacter sp. MMS18-M83]WAH97081.1 endolytic transglycosylase MltG [Arthrobacter sp. MMS18-M83]